MDAITGSAPHANEAARRAKRDGEAMQHHFGAPSYFLTVAPDDDNSFIIQVYSGVVVNDNVPISSLSDEELTSCARARTEIHLRCPGMCTFCFELALEMILEEVTGWSIIDEDFKENFAGIFAVPEAFVVTTEEQGCRTLHGHMQIWRKGFDKSREQLHSSTTSL